MTTETFYLVQGFTAGKRSKLSPMPAMEVASASAALRRAEQVAERNGGALAVSRTGDPFTGDYDDPVILGSFGRVPAADG